MPKTSETPNTSVALRALIVCKSEHGLKPAEIASFCNISVWTVRRIIAKHRAGAGLEDSIRSGRPKKLDDRQIRHLKRSVLADRRQSLQDITNSMSITNALKASERTIKRALNNDLGLSKRVAAKKPFLLKRHQQARLAWAKDRTSMSTEDWHHVIWTDEASIELGKQSRVTWVWRKPNERYETDCIAPTFKSGRSSVMVWGCIAYNRKGPLIVIPQEKRTGDDYVDLILEPVLHGFYTQLCEERSIMALMEDGAPTHRSTVAKRWREDHEILVFDHPAQSPDLNPIEHVWKHLKLQINKRKKLPQSSAELEAAIMEEWDKIDIQFINNLVDSMANRVQAVLKAKGKSTHY